MIDYKLFDILTLLEKMLDKQPMYLTNAAQSGKLEDIKISFNATTDSHGVPVKLQHAVELSWKA